MSLRTRLSLAASVLALLIVMGFGALAYWLFVRHQDAQLRGLLDQDLARISALMDRPSLGASFADTSATGFVLQLVASDGHIVIGWGSDALLPLLAEPETIELDDRTYLVAHAPWRATSGTIRLAHDVSGAFRSRAELARSLILSGLTTALVAALAALVGTRRLLRPLERVSLQARNIDPTDPGAIDYEGPKDEIHTLTDALNGALVAIRDRKREERDFLLEVAHELAAPLTLVNYHLADVRSERPHDGRLRAAAEASQELLRTSQDLLVLARGELERPLALEVLALRDLLMRVADEYPGVSVDADGPGEVVGDPERLMQVIRNLVRNGVQAAGSTDRVQVLLRSAGEHQVIEVRDQGPGMDELTLGRIFERHYRRGGGAGVGLSISKSLVEQHGGAIHASSRLGEGSSFQVRLPCLSTLLEPASPATTT